MCIKYFCTLQVIEVTYRMNLSHRQLNAVMKHHATQSRRLSSTKLSSAGPGLRSSCLDRCCTTPTPMQSPRTLVAVLKRSLARNIRTAYLRSKNQHVQNDFNAKLIESQIYRVHASLFTQHPHMILAEYSLTESNRQS